MKLPIHMRLGVNGLSSDEAPARRNKKIRSNRRKRLVQVLCLVCSLLIILMAAVNRRMWLKKFCGCFSEGYVTSGRWRRCLRLATPFASTLVIAQVAVMVMAGTAT